MVKVRYGVTSLVDEVLPKRQVNARLAPVKPTVGVQYPASFQMNLRANGEERKVRRGGQAMETLYKKVWPRQRFFVAFGGGMLFII